MKKSILILLFFASLHVYGATNFHLQEQTVPEYREMLDQVYEMLSKQAHYLLLQVKTYHGNSTIKLLTKSMHGEHGIRPNTGTVMGLSFLYRFGDYNSEWVGVNKKQLLEEYIIPMMNYLVVTYDSVPTDDGKYWKEQWQSAAWAYSLGKAAWYLGDELPLMLREGVCHIVKAEAKRFYDVEPPHRVKYDTAAEENAWNAQIFHIASLLMPDAAEYTLWQSLFTKWVVSSYVTEKDLKEHKIVGEFPVSSLAGANLYDDYTLENHGIVHPDYMSAFIISLQTAVDYKMTGKDVPDFLLYNIPQIYDNLKWFTLPDGGLTYPSWQDWRIFRNPDWFINHVYMSAFAHDDDALHYAKEVLGCIKLMQARHSEGNIYNKDEYFFPSAQQDIMGYLLHAWQALHYVEGDAGHYASKKGIRHFESGKILLNKSKDFVHSLSYANKIMFLPTLNRKDRLFDSYRGSGIGEIRKNGEQNSLALSLKDIRIKTDKHSYFVEMSVVHGDVVEARYIIKAHEDKLQVKEKLIAMSDCDLSLIATSKFGVLNNKCWVWEKGYRTLSWGGQVHKSLSLSGNEYVIDADRLKVDDVQFVLKRKEGNLLSKYSATCKYECAKVTDVLCLNYSDTPGTFTKNEVISELEYTIKLSK